MKTPGNSNLNDTADNMNELSELIYGHVLLRNGKRSRDDGNDHDDADAVRNKKSTSSNSTTLPRIAVDALVCTLINTSKSKRDSDDYDDNDNDDDDDTDVVRNKKTRTVKNNSSSNNSSLKSDDVLCTIIDASKGSSKGLSKCIHNINAFAAV